MMSFKDTYTAVNFLWTEEEGGFKAENILRPCPIAESGWGLHACPLAN